MTEAAKEVQRILDCPDVSYNGLHLPTLARLAREMNNPHRHRLRRILMATQ